MQPFGKKDEFSDVVHKEWLVTDGRGSFAMGTPEGIRTRKYHGFCLGIAGRAEAAFLADLGMSIGGQNLWPHRYRGGVDAAGPAFRYTSTVTGPEWEWILDEPSGVLRFAVKAQRQKGIELQWSWKSTRATARKIPIELKIRPFFAMRPLHSLGGATWSFEDHEDESGDTRLRVLATGADAVMLEPLYLVLSGNWKWNELPFWYNEFYYAEELARGYPAEENLFSAGEWTLMLKDGEPARILMAEEADILSMPQQPARRRARSMGDVRVPALDFVVHEPAGVVAGYPWFGEWGRDTFVSLPGLAIRWLESGGKSHEVSSWVDEVLNRWGQWIQLTGMLPNLIEKNGSHQWESADATLWWCHSLASLWAFGAAGRKEFHGLDKRFKPLLDQAIDSITSGRHVFLKLAADGMLEVTEPHSTWMDARIEGCAVTPRKGRLPEINALWFQARCLQALWSEEGDLKDLLTLGRKTLDRLNWEASENDRPNFIFLHSIPLAPSFVLRESAALRKDLERAETFWTPVGLRSLKPTSRAYQAKCVGTQAVRDQAYHQGTVWGWLGGHFEMAKQRAEMHDEFETFPINRLESMPIEGHISEIFDGDPPFTSRGAPAQAWSLACLDEARAKKRLNVDAKLSDILSRRWLGKEERRTRRSNTRSRRGHQEGPGQGQDQGQGGVL
jgi:predicted glycogen debranching enzyme